jgi:phospholipid N-methyltransferase
MNLLSRFFNNPLRCGALCPSSRNLCNAMTTGYGLEDARCVVELGPGTGAITREIVARAKNASTIAAIELDPALCDALHTEFPNVHIFNASATDTYALLNAHKLPAADAVVSGLPWAHFNEELQAKIIESVRAALTPHGTFATFAYCSGFLLPGAHSFRRQLRKNFSNIRTSPWIIKNIPPAFVYYCSN